MSYVIDRFEGIFAVCQNLENDEMKNIKKSLLPDSVKEGDVIYFEAGTYFFDSKKTSERLDLISKKFNSIWK